MAHTADNAGGYDKHSVEQLLSFLEEPALEATDARRQQIQRELEKRFAEQYDALVGPGDCGAPNPRVPLHRNTTQSECGNLSRVPRPNPRIPLRLGTTESFCKKSSRVSGEETPSDGRCLLQSGS